MEESNASKDKQEQSGDDSGYSCTSNLSKSSNSCKSRHSQSASSRDSCFEDRNSPTLKSNEDGKSSTSNSKSPDEPEPAVLKDSSDDSQTTANQEETNNVDLEPEQMTLNNYEQQIGELFEIDKLKQQSTDQILESDLNHDKNEPIDDYDRNKGALLQLASLCQSFREYLKTKSINIYSNESTLKELNDHETQLKEIIESNETVDGSFGVVISMTNGLIINTSNSIIKNMGYPKDMWQGRSFIDFIHPKDRISFISYMTSVLTNPSMVSGRDGKSTVTFLRAKNNDGFYCNMRKYEDLNAGFSVTHKKVHYQVCKLTIAFKETFCTNTPTCLVEIIAIHQPQLLLIVKAQLIHSAYSCPEEKKENPQNFITKHNALLEWCYVDHLIISHFGYLPQNIIGRCVFDYYNMEDLSVIKEIYENMTKARNVPYKGKPYRFKCQNGDFALVQTEWSNFINPWSGRVEFIIGRHKVIQGPLNPDVTTPIDDISFEKSPEDKKNSKEVCDEVKKILNKKVIGAPSILQKLKSPIETSTNLKKQISNKCKDLAMFMNFLVDGIDPSIQIPLEVEIQPEHYDSFSDRDSVMLGEISPHHNHESKSSSGTPPSYTQLNYNDNIQRFFESNFKRVPSDNTSVESYSKSGSLEDTSHLEKFVTSNKVKADQLLLMKNPSSSIANAVSNQESSKLYSEQKSKRIKQPPPLTQAMLLRHNKKMENDLVKQHKTNAKRFKFFEKLKKNVQEELNDTSDTTHGIKRSNSSMHDNKIAKRKHAMVNNPTTVNTQTQDSETSPMTPTVARSTQIWPPCLISRDSQTMVDLPKPNPNHVLYYKLPLSNNVMRGNPNEYENNTFNALAAPNGKTQDNAAEQLQPLTLPLFMTIPVLNQMTPKAQLFQPYLLLQNQSYAQQTYKKNAQFQTKSNSEREQPNTMPKDLDQTQKKTKTSQAQQEEIVTSSDSECRREIGSLKSSNGWIFEDSSLYSSSIRNKTDSFESYVSSGKDDLSWPLEFGLSGIRHQFIKKPFWMEGIMATPDLIFRYQMQPVDMNEVLRQDMNALKELTQPLLVSEQLRQLYMELNINTISRPLSNDDESSSNSGEECLISIGENHEKYNFDRMAMIYEENAPLPPPTNPIEIFDRNTN
ncbi:period circadian protein isoform X3 [Daktulosphaira vitifoliae]|uniref:period circadian protein isoform X3 n=1 Tax=Daktulosphaira vitifoliae TaxID=58002 RepID=UPI0021A99422|nr:period circadian protein isoform X3 [Daktulosphaira vitifoliae]